ncbi:ring-hydroxylating dioxygenase ferredoxin reductase family protein [Saccharopolyspora sp. HNM0986]|uniref:benzoate 1,2-dioxygenase electron transfer component BenC n=1 Tax=Saccharopolyspora galaxeae TaxID=2781241 RepID=UPI001F368B6C|nr:benzoate 1,2-dioxygenase electron transfer component BenC [Saccharopolyspora sp. HNM0986]MBK0869530.1 ring-hydroxylating dioxygenase ferredoxin reductase family protein [Saccharopolyspora sp. HNM0986]
MNHQVALSFEDGITRFVTCAPHETVADASYKARINIPLDCRDGACGTCKSFCESGDYDGGDYIEDALTDEEAERGYLLACQAMPRSDMIVQIAGTSEAAKTGAATHQATVTDVVLHSDSTIGFTLELDDRDALSFLPGQYVNVAVPGADCSRSYSFSNGPDDKQVSFLVRYTEGGAMSEYLKTRARAGDRVEFTGPMGGFFLREINRRALLLAGGTGLAPLLAMLEKLRETGLEHPVHLVYGVTADQDLVEVQRLQDYAEALPQFTFETCVAEESSEHPNKGYVTKFVGPEHLADGDVDVYLCGPPPMVEAVRSDLAGRGVTPAHFHYEKFNPAGAA